MSEQLERTVVDGQGAHWIYVPREIAHAHPKGRPGIVIYLIAAWLAATGGLEVALMLAGRVPWWAGLLGGLSMLTALGLLMRAPIAMIFAIILPVRHTVGMIGGVTVLTGVSQFDAVFVLVQAIIPIGIIFYLLEAERPNLIYRLRYRSYEAERIADARDEEAS